MPSNWDPSTALGRGGNSPSPRKVVRRRPGSNATGGAEVPHTSGRQRAVPVSKTAAASWRCWMCDAPCLDQGWEGVSTLLRPSHAQQQQQQQRTLPPHHRPLSLLTLCRRCTSALSSPPGANLLDIMHQCNSTFASRSRSYTFVAFLREYKILLELVALEAADEWGSAEGAAPSSKLMVATPARHPNSLLVDVSDAGDSRGSSAFFLTAETLGLRAHLVFEQLLQCIENTLQEEVGLRDSARREPPPVRAIARRGEEWLLRPTERELLEAEGSRHRVVMSWLQKRRDLATMDSERQERQQKRRSSDLMTTPTLHLANDSFSVLDIPTTEDSGTHARTVPRERAKQSKQNAHHSSSSLRDGGAHQEVHTNRAGGDGAHSASMGELLRSYFSGAVQSLPVELFEGPVAPLLDTATASVEMLSHHDDGDHGADDARRLRVGGSEGGMPHDWQEDPQVSTSFTTAERSNAVTLQKVEHEMIKLRREHDRQRHEWGQERDALINDVVSLRSKIEELELSASTLHREHRRSLSEHASAVADATRAVTAMRSVSFQFGIWCQAAAHIASEVQRIKVDLLVVEAGAIARRIALTNEGLCRRLEGLEAVHEQSDRYEVLLATARREIMRGGRGASGVHESQSPAQRDLTGDVSFF